MDMEILKRLYWACSGDPHNEVGLNLCELYQRIEDTETADRDFTEAVQAAKLPVSDAESIWEATCAANIAYELQGFVNGFRLAMRIATGKAV